jgi:lipopolysaccharide/colanic/teichoic acid biosynthesis glycosyltransferase
VGLVLVIVLASHRDSSMFVKRCIDVSLSALVLLLLSPVFAVVALAIWLESGLPVLFRQERMGRDFRQFWILKFRSMRTGIGGPSVTIDGDSRVTKVGRILRLTKIDELPQFWNVLLGEMSIVGPRPEVPQYVDLFRERYCRILTVRPGITDLGSIHFRNEERILALSQDPLREYRERVLPRKLDMAEKYIREQSLLGDFVIIARTAFSTLWPRISGQEE